MRWLVLVVALAACGPVVPGNADPTTSGSSVDDGATTAPDDPATTMPGTTVGTTAPGTSVGPTSDMTSNADSGRVDSGIIWDEGPCFRPPCDPWLPDDCQAGEQCNPSDECGTPGTWSTNRCKPLDPDPDAIGDPCTVDDTPYSGLESCGADAFCFGVDPVTLVGTCVALCTGTVDDPVCVDPSTTCLIANDGVLTLCLQACDPLLQDCDSGYACHPRAWQDDFVCMPEGALIETDQTPTACPTGSTDVDASLVPSQCAPDAEVCCATFCDLTLAMPDCGEGLECAFWYERGVSWENNPGICVGAG